MPGTAIGLSMNYGYAGTIAKTWDDVVEAKPINASSANIPFGAPVIQNTDNTVTLGGATLTAANFAGVALAEVHQNLGYSAINNTGGFYTPSSMCPIVQRGIVSVVVQRGTPTTPGSVYVRTVANGSFPTAVVGGFEATADGSNSVLLTNASWEFNQLDANNVGLLKLKSINN